VISAVVAAALWALGAGLVLSIVLGLLVAGLIAFGRPAAATRQALWSLALAAAGFAPVAILAVMLVRGAFASEVHKNAPTSTHALPSSALAPSRHSSAAGPAVVLPAPALGIELRVPQPPQIAPRLATGLVALWLAGALFGLGGLGRSVARVRGLKARSSPLDGTLATELPWLTTTPGREIYLRLTYETETPIAVGFMRPVILLPAEMATADGLTTIEPLIMHEYAHLARYDDWTNLLQRTTERLFWFNPVVWILGRRIALEREVAADEAVVARTRDPKRYASTLWRMAQEMRMPEHVVVAPGAMLTRKQISVRIERLLDEHPAGQRYIGAAAFAIVVVTVSGVAALAAGAPPMVFAHIAVADNITPAPKAVVKLLPQPVAKLPTVPKLSIIAAPVALPSEARRAIANSVALAVNKQQMGQNFGQQIASEVQQSLTGVNVPHGKLDFADSRGPVSREMLARCIGCDFSHRDLRGFDFSNMSLVGDTFDRADLRGANFSNSKLEGLSFQRADLGKANFHAAKLTGIDFTRATLDGVDLSDAALIGVDLTRASIAGANTTGIRLIGSSL
jgi:beta-lactamase regulating signal transducer with metallopeptidase domain